MLSDKLVLVELIARLLTDILADTRQLPRGSSPFHCKETPAISVSDYLKRTPSTTQASSSLRTAPTLSS